jgi:hypothetical protein
MLSENVAAAGEIFGEIFLVCTGTFYSLFWVYRGSKSLYIPGITVHHGELRKFVYYLKGYGITNFENSCTQEKTTLSTGSQT